MKRLTIVFVQLLVVAIFFSCEESNYRRNSITFLIDNIKLNQTDTLSLDLNAHYTLKSEISCDKETSVKVYRQIDGGEFLDISGSENVKNIRTSYENGFGQTKEIYIYTEDSLYTKGQELEYTIQINTIKFGDFRKSVVFRIE